MKFLITGGAGYVGSTIYAALEDAGHTPVSPYARTKYMMEMVLRDFCIAYGMKGFALRYFNPIGADPQMRSGIHVEHSTHVLGKMMEAAQGRLEAFEITGTDRAKALLDWEAKLPIEQGLADALRWDKLRGEILGFGE